jgi:hypothetical protein
MSRITMAVVLLLTPVALLAQTPSNNAVITLRRSACFGGCPIYKVTLREDGSVVYVGDRFVRVKGTQKSKIDPAEFQSLLKAFDDIDYFGLENSYHSILRVEGNKTYEIAPSDLSTTYTSLTVSSRTKRVEDYCCSPEKLRALEREIDNIAGTKCWVTIDAACVHEESRRGWAIHGTEATALLFGAARGGDFEVVQAFLQEGVNANAKFQSRTLLQEARGVAVVRLLIAAGAAVNVPDDSDDGSPLASAAAHGDADSVRVLLKAGANVNSLTKGQKTALMMGVFSANVEVVRTLLAAGAKTELTDKFGRNPLDYANFDLERKQWDESWEQPSKAVKERKERLQEIQRLLTEKGETTSGT